MPEYILFVDDEKLIKRLVAHYFRNQIRQGKYEFIFAYNGIEALEKLQENPLINLVITDINMPEMDGLTLLENIRESHENTKAIIVSAYEDLKLMRKAMNLGALDFINKPIDFEDLENSINRTLDSLYQSKQHNTLDSQSQLPRFTNPQSSVVSQLVTDAMNDSNHTINLMSGNLFEAQSVIEDMIRQLQIYQDKFTDISPEIIYKIQDTEQENLWTQLSQMMLLMKHSTERLEEIGKNLKTPAKQEVSN